MSCGTQVPPPGCSTVSVTGLSPSLAALPFAFSYRLAASSLAVLQPRAAHCYARGLGSSAFARHYSRNHCYFLFLRVLRCFSSPRSPGALRRDGIAAAGFPHSDIGGSCGYLPLAAAFRSLSRPSSPPRATGIPHAPFCVPFFLQRNSHEAYAPCKSPYWSLTLVCSCETFVFLLVLADILALCRTDVSLPACQCSLLMWRITDSNR